MTDPQPALPPWVKKSDGRVVPFDPDAIGQDLFAVQESLGQADPFLTRELADAVLHFLATECTEGIPTTDWIADLVVKVIRELRQPRLAQAFSERTRIPSSAAADVPPRPPVPTPAEVVRRSLEAYSLDNVFSRDLAAAHRDGLLSLRGLEAPRDLAAAVLTPPEPTATLPALRLLDAVLEARGGVAGWLAVDGAEYLDLERGSPPLPRLLMPVLQAAELKARLNLNIAEPPPWARQVAEGPLFADQAGRRTGEPLATTAAVVQAFLALDREHCPFAIDWHLGARDFAAAAEPVRGELLQSMVRGALGEYPITFVFDRPRRPPSLGPGLDRLHSYLLLTVGLDLPQLLRHTGISDDAELFLRKLASLARLAVSAGVQKRHYVRETLHDAPVERSFLQRGFVVDRARLVVVPLGLDEAARRLTGAELHEGKAALDLARRMVQELRSVLEEESKRRLVDCVLDISEGALCFHGATPVRQQLTLAGRLHAAAGAGTAEVALSEEERLSVDQVVRLLEYAWKQSDLSRLSFQPRPAAELQPTLLG